jgi:uncharacterized protein YjbI with pentapeptide repeats
MSDQAWNAQRRVEGKWIAWLADDRGVISVPVSLAGAWIAGEMECSLLTFSRAVSICGCDVEKRAKFLNCRFQGSLDLSSTVWAEGLNLDSAQIEGTFTCNGSRSEIRGSASFRRASFKDGFELRGGQITRADFAGASFAKDAQFLPYVENGVWSITRFVDQARFMDTKFGLFADFSSVRFEGDAEFTRASIAGPAFFRVFQPSTFSIPAGQANAPFAPVAFGGKAIFFAAAMQAGADFTAAQFQGEADFRWASISRFAIFRVSEQGTGVAFGGKVDFNSAQVSGRFILEGVEFKNDATFEAFQVSGNALIRSAPTVRTVFKGRANFLDTVISGTADFCGARFEEHALFGRLRVGGAAFFRKLLPNGSDIEFRAGADFSDSSFAGMATFECAQFGDVTFRRTIFYGIAYFGGTHFTGRADFSDSDFRQDVYWGIYGGANPPVSGSFEQPATFARARIGGSGEFTGMVLPDADFTSIKIGGDLRLDLREPSGRPSLVLNDVTVKGALIAGETMTKYRPELKTASVVELEMEARIIRKLARACNLHTLLQFEKAYRAAGDERAGDKAYLKARDVERRLHWKKLFRAGSELLDRLEALGALVLDALRWLFRYGLPAIRVLVYSIILFSGGVWLLYRPGALEVPKPTTAVGSQAAARAAGQCVSGNWHESFWAMAAITIPGDAARNISPCRASSRIAFLDWPYNICAAVLSWLTVILFSVFVAGYARLFKYKG